MYTEQTSFMPQDLVEIQVEQPQKNTQSLRILMASGLRLFYSDICLSWTFRVTQSKGHSGLATFYGTGFGTCGYNDKQ